MNSIYVVFDYYSGKNVMSFETREMAQSFMLHPANFGTTLDYEIIKFRSLPVDLTVPEFVR